MMRCFRKCAEKVKKQLLFISYVSRTCQFSPDAPHVIIRNWTNAKKIQIFPVNFCFWKFLIYPRSTKVLELFQGRTQESNIVLHDLKYHEQCLKHKWCQQHIVVHYYTHCHYIAVIKQKENLLTRKPCLTISSWFMNVCTVCRFLKIVRVVEMPQGYHWKVEKG